MCEFKGGFVDDGSCGRLLCEGEIGGPEDVNVVIEIGGSDCACRGLGEPQWRQNVMSLCQGVYIIWFVILDCWICDVGFKCIF